MKRKINKLKHVIIIILLLSIMPLFAISKGDELNKECIKINDNNLTLDMKSWINNGSYWSDSIIMDSISDTDTITLSEEIKSWMKKGSLWCSNDIK